MSSHRSIFKSTAIVGGTQIANIVIGMARNKVLAMWLGPVGLGLSGTYLTVTGFIGGITGLGLGASGVRQIAEASASGDEDKLARTVIALRRASLLSGLFGMMIALLLCIPLSHATFGDGSRSGDLALMSLTLLCGGISAGQIALLQGLRRLGDMGRAQVAGAFFGSLAGVVLIYFFRERGIALFLIANAAWTVIFAYWFAHKVPIKSNSMTWRESYLEARSLMTLGLAFVIQNLLLGASGYLCRIIIIHKMGLGAVGLYTATWTLSSYYVGMVLKAMGTDFYPRLTAAAKNHSTMNRLVNEQIEMGLLIAVPGILAVLALAPWALHLLYSGDFVTGAGIIRWQVLGVFVQVFSWPASIVIIAKGHRRLFVISEVINAAGGVGFLLLGMHFWKLDGIGIGFFLATVTSAVYSFFVAHRSIELVLIRRCSQMLGLSIVAVAMAFFIPRILPVDWHLPLGILLATASGVTSLFVLKKLLGVNVVNMIRAKFSPQK